MIKKNTHIWLVLLGFSFFLSCQETNKEETSNKEKKVVAQFVIDDENYKNEHHHFLVRVYDDSLTSDLVLANTLDCNPVRSVVLRRQSNDFLITIFAARKWPLGGSYGYPEEYPDTYVPKKDYHGRDFCVDGGLAFYLSDSFNIMVYCDRWALGISKESADSILTGILKNLSIVPYTWEMSSTEENIGHFMFPKIKQRKDSFPSEYWRNAEMLVNPSIFQGIFRFGEEVVIKRDVKFSDYNARCYRRQKHDGFQIFDDFFNDIGIWVDSLNEGRFYYPLYLVNETSHTLKIPIDKNGPRVLQELWIFWHGQLKNLEILPIERLDKGNFWGEDAMIIPPRNFAMFLLPKYDGDFKTDIRCRITIGDNEYLTENHGTGVNRELLKSFGEKLYWKKGK